MKRIAFLFIAVVTVAWLAPLSLGQDNKGQGNTGMTAGEATQSDGKGAKQVIVTTIPPGYRDWKFISAAHEAGELNDYALWSATKKRSRPIAKANPSPRALSSVELLGRWFHQKRTTRHLVKRNRSFPETHPTGTCSLWRRTPRSTPRRAVGVTRILVKTSNHSPTKKLCTLAFPATKPSTNPTSAPKYLTHRQHRLSISTRMRSGRIEEWVHKTFSIPRLTASRRRP